MTETERTALRQRLVNEYIQGLQAARGNNRSGSLRPTSVTAGCPSGCSCDWLSSRFPVGVHALACGRSRTAQDKTR